MEVIAWSQHLSTADARAAAAQRVEKAALFGRADFVSIHYKLSERSVGIVGAAEIGAMKRTAFLVNTSRGPLVDLDALLAALREGRIAGAALDVYDQEPLPLDHPLRSAPRTVLSPHIGYVATGSSSAGGGRSSKTSRRSSTAIRSASSPRARQRRAEATGALCVLGLAMRR